MGHALLLWIMVGMGSSLCFLVDHQLGGLPAGATAPLLALGVGCGSKGHDQLMLTHTPTLYPGGYLKPLQISTTEIVRVRPHLHPAIPIFVRPSPSSSSHPHLRPAGPTGPYRPMSYSLPGLSYVLFP